MGVGIYREESGVLEVYANGQDRPGQIDSNRGRDGRFIAAFCEEYRGTLERFSVGRMDIPANQKERMLALFDATHAAILIPMIFQDRLMGIIAVGEKRSGELFVHEDTELLETIASQGAIAIENARNYERLEEMNLNLEKKVQERTRALTAALEEKERTQRQLIQSESLASIGQLVAGTAHELNNPLASSSSLIQTCADTVEEWSGIDDAAREELVEDLRFSIRELDRAAEIVRSLLGLSRQTQTYVERVNVNILIDDALRVLRNRYKNTAITIERDLADDLPEIEGNFANLGQVAVNIINNAIQAQQDGKGTITLITRHEEEANMVRVACRDTGRGMSPGEIRDAFKPFFTTKSPGEGTGLGLYIAHEIIQRHGGNIAIQSEPGRGTTVSVTLPCRRREE
jgi:two-component system NtrC family sensor kinase